MEKKAYLLALFKIERKKKSADTRLTHVELKEKKTVCLLRQIDCFTHCIPINLEACQLSSECFENRYALFPAVNFFRLGCFQDNRTRAMPEELRNWRSDQSNAVRKCAQTAKSAGYLVFGVQYGGECWSGPLAHVTYKKYGTSTRCVSGTGGSWAQDVYRIVSK